MNIQVGWGTKSKLLHSILKQLEKLSILISRMSGGGSNTHLSELINDVGFVTGEEVQPINWGEIITHSYKGELLTVPVSQNSSGAGTLLSLSNFSFTEDITTTNTMFVMALEDGEGTKSVLLRGQISNPTWEWESGPLYVSETTGKLTQSPSQLLIGWTLSPTTIYFSPQQLQSAEIHSFTADSTLITCDDENVRDDFFEINTDMENLYNLIIE